MILDGDFSYFQSNPFNQPVDCGHLAMNFYEENTFSINFQYMNIDNKEIWSAMKKVFDMNGEKLHNELDKKFVVNPTAFFGHQYVLQRYLIGLIDLLAYTDCMEHGCDFAAVNYMWYKEILEVGSPISVSLLSHQQGCHLINTGIASSLNFLIKRNLFDDEKKLYLNWDQEPSTVVLNYQLNTEMVSVFNERLKQLLKEFPHE